MKIGVYRNPTLRGPLVLVSHCMRPSIEVERSMGPLLLQGVVESDAPGRGFAWSAPLAALRTDMHAIVANVSQIACLLQGIDLRTSASGVLMSPALAEDNNDAPESDGAALRAT
jgi:hypothetical protein